ncbi:MAG TPA: transcriptional repressor [Candidatus Eisenbergiella stercoravium]|nr:transcriptional repressor [Candidatus Eisenbergiella stercoravium]
MQMTATIEQERQAGRRRERILEELRRNGFRITSQRKLLIDIILSDECSCCKEIYYQAVRQDPSIGIATVYRMVKTLEDIGAINRKNMYRINCEENCGFRGDCVLVLENKEKVSFSMDEFKEAVGEVLRKKGYQGQQKVETVLWNQG